MAKKVEYRYTVIVFVWLITEKYENRQNLLIHFQGINWFVMLSIAKIKLHE